MHIRYAIAQNYSFSYDKFINAKYYEPSQNLFKLYDDILQSLVLCKQGKINRLLSSKNRILLLPKIQEEKKNPSLSQGISLRTIFSFSETPSM